MEICFYTTGDIKYIATMKRALGMAEPLIKLGWDVSIIALDSEENKKRIKLEAPNAKTFYFKASNPFIEILLKHGFLKTVKPDVVWICSLGFRNFIFPWNKYKTLVEHSELGSAIPDNKGLKFSFILFFEKFSKSYSGLVCASQYLLEHFSINKPSKLKIHYSPYAYNKKIIDSPTIKLDSLKKDFKNKICLLYMGTMTKNYGLFTMLEAVKIVSKINPNVVLILLGRGRHLEESKQFVINNKLQANVFFKGYINEEELSSYFKLAEGFLAPLNDTIQDWARCPSKIYMYLPYKKPILTSKIGEPSVIFGEQGYYFESTKPDTLVDLIIRVVLEQSENMNINIARHSWDKRAQDFDDWFKREF